MNITQFTEYLNKQKGWNVDPGYYAKIELWKQWWCGYVPEVHDIKENGADGIENKRQMASMRMPKRACCDWASLLINDKTTISLGDKASAEWLLGNQDQTGGLLRTLNFWPEANSLVELAFRSGTGAFVLSAENMLLKNGIPTPSKDAQLCLDYDPAECILPLTVRHGVVTEVAFASQILVGGKRLPANSYTGAESGWRNAISYHKRVLHQQGRRYRKRSVPACSAAGGRGGIL